MTVLRLHHRRASLLSFAAALSALATLSACTKKPERPQRQTPTVAVAQVRRATVPYVIEANGIVTPMQSVAVTPQVDGVIKSVDFQEGQEVVAGQALFHIDSRPYENAYNQARAVLARDSANWANARANADRYKALMAAKVITPQEGEAQLTTAAQTAATLDADRANVAQARFNLDNTVIRAPISGKTGSLLVKRGNVVRAGGQSPLVVINQVRPILVRFAIPSSQLPLVLQYGAKGGLPVAAVPGGIAAPTPSIDSLAAAAMNPVQDPPGGRANAVQQQGGPTGDRLAGKLSFIDNAVDTATGTVQLKATFDNQNGRLLAGQFATTSLHLFDEDSAIVVPQQAVVTGQRGTYVYVVDPTDTARQRAVIVERNAGGLSVIANGLHQGERVVTDGQSRLTPDSPVRLRGANDGGGGNGMRRSGGRGGRSGRGGSGANGGSGGSSGGGGSGRRGG
jgi:multidrug efflux system membrane fusion protein